MQHHCKLVFRYLANKLFITFADSTETTWLVKVKIERSTKCMLYVNTTLIAVFDTEVFVYCLHKILVCANILVFCHPSEGSGSIVTARKWITSQVWDDKARELNRKNLVDRFYPERPKNARSSGDPGPFRIGQRLSAPVVKYPLNVCLGLSAGVAIFIFCCCTPYRGGRHYINGVFGPSFEFYMPVSKYKAA